MEEDFKIKMKLEIREEIKSLSKDLISLQTLINSEKIGQI